MRLKTFETALELAGAVYIAAYINKHSDEVMELIGSGSLKTYKKRTKIKRLNLLRDLLSDLVMDYLK